MDKLTLEKYKQYYSSIESFERQIEPVYFTPYPIYLIAQNECQKMVYLIKTMIIFITILPLSILIKSEPVMNIFQDVLDYLVIEFYVLIILIIVFGPLAIYFTKKDLEEH